MRPKELMIGDYLNTSFGIGRVVYAASGLEAASEAVNDWLEANGLDTTFSVSL